MLNEHSPETIASSEQFVEHPESHGVSRREFALDLAIAAGVAAVIPVDALAQTEKVASPVKPPVTAQPDLSSEAKVEAESNYQAVVRKYGSRLNSEQKAEVQRLLLQQQKSIEMLRNYRIENGDGPAAVLHLVTEEAE